MKCKAAAIPCKPELVYKIGTMTIRHSGVDTVLALLC